jgi:hypothetical protein
MNERGKEMEIQERPNFKQYYDDLGKKPDIEKTDNSFKDIEDICIDILQSLPHLDYGAYELEMSEMVIHTYENPTTFQLLEALDQVQQYKNRLSEIMNDIEQEYSVRKTTLELLEGANNVASIQKSADKRNGEAMMRYPTLYLKKTAIESLRTLAMSTMNNLKAIGDVVSRQASIIGFQISLGEYKKKNSLDIAMAREDSEYDYKSGVSSVDWGETLKG